jgi:ATP-binding cassette, subfamily B, bacterial
MKRNKFFGLFLMKYLKGQRRSMILLAVFFIGNIVLMILSPQVLSYFIDSAQSGKAMGYISLIVLAYMVTIIFNMAGEVCESYFAQSFGWDVYCCKEYDEGRLSYRRFQYFRCLSWNSLRS